MAILLYWRSSNAQYIRPGMLCTYSGCGSICECAWFVLRHLEHFSMYTCLSYTEDKHVDLYMNSTRHLHSTLIFNYSYKCYNLYKVKV